MGWIVGTFLAMYLIATILGFATYLLLSPLAMWISVFTVMPFLSTLLIYVYLRRMKFSRGASLRESLVVPAAWIVLPFGFGCSRVYRHHPIPQPCRTKLDFFSRSIAVDLAVLCCSTIFGPRCSPSIWKESQCLM